MLSKRNNVIDLKKLKANKEISDINGSVSAEIRTGHLPTTNLQNLPIEASLCVA